jgi:two-component system LytT family response regulator
MIQCIIVDDEDPARRHMRHLLEAHQDLNIGAEASNGIEAIEVISEQRPDVAFLDIEMPGVNAFDLIAQLRHPPLIVFTTAFDKYAVSAFDANALDYLLKPIQPIRLAQALEKIRATLKKPREEYESMLQRKLGSLRTLPPSKLAARRGRRIVLLSPKDVIYVVLESQIVFYHTETERFVTDRTLAELEELLAPAGFFRVSRSAIVNLNHARELLPWSSGTWRVKLSNNVELDVSRDRARSLRSKIG